MPQRIVPAPCHRTTVPGGVEIMASCALCAQVGKQQNMSEHNAIERRQYKFHLPLDGVQLARGPVAGYAGAAGRIPSASDRFFSSATVLADTPALATAAFNCSFLQPNF